MKYGKMLFGHVKVMGLWGRGNFIIYQEGSAFGVFSLGDEPELKEIAMECTTDEEHTHRIADYRLCLATTIEEALSYCKKEDAELQMQS